MSLTVGLDTRPVGLTTVYDSPDETRRYSSALYFQFRMPLGFNCTIGMSRALSSMWEVSMAQQVVICAKKHAILEIKAAFRE